ncbi:Clp protease ClpP [Schinkia azotoformans]|uniref:head maturation protease, ClpP-related n=1 Tax=Schinkia azotoformans TaxID=1454 RepID=UPI002DBC4A82|nr:head maturation protease, ClpP-related [Schinkia azotoformans]MEC1723928.1 Clp protease ClpP [Schinkia azotoformans]
MTVKINVKGAIIINDYKEIYDFYEMESTSPNDILNALPANNEAVEVVINSGGGHLNAGSEIYSILKDYKGQVTTKIVALAGSAASVIAMAGDKVIIAPTAQIMIHNVSSIAQGDYNEMLHTAGVLKEMNRSIANAYILKTGKSEAEVLDLMNKETWLSARSALQHGFVDEIMGVSADNLSEFLVASTNVPNMLPLSVIEKYREVKNQQKQPPKPAQKKKRHGFIYL